MRRLLPLSAIAALVLGLASNAAAQQLDAIFERANAAYFASDFETAATLYEQLIEAGVDDPDVTYNLALAHARAGRLGQSIRWLERTLLLRPGDEDAERDLAAVREELGRRQADSHGEAIVETRPPFVESLVRPLTEPTLAWLVLVLDFAFFSLLLVRRRTRGETARLALGVAAPILFVLVCAAAFGLATKTGLLSDGEPAIVVATEATLHEGPDERAGSRGTTLEGERVRLVAVEQGWAEVRLGDGRNGWTPRDAVAPIARSTLDRH
jgi:tetratricopeptide (TPR) repeat protein